MNPSQLHIDSRYRNVGDTANNFNIKINPALKQIKGCCLKALNLPVTHYNINTTNNHIIIVDSLNNEYDILLTPGSYDINTLLVELTNEFNNVFPDVFTITYNTITFKLNFSTTIEQFYFKWLNLNNSMSRILGYNNNNTNLSLTSQGIYPIDLSLPPCFFIKIDQFNNLVYSTMDICATFAIYITQNSGYITYHFNKTHYETYTNNNTRDINMMHVQLILPDGSLFDINNSDWSFLIELIY